MLIIFTFEASPFLRTLSIKQCLSKELQHIREDLGLYPTREHVYEVPLFKFNINEILYST